MMLQWGRTLSSAEVILVGACRIQTGALRWGRTLSSAEVNHLLCFFHFLAVRFNGAALFQVRKSFGEKETPAGGLLLQWGRTLSSAEVLGVGKGTDKKIWASMGPHSFKCGSK